MDTANNKQKPRGMRLEALCREAGLSRSTIYQYLRSGILQPPIKEGPTQSRYDETHLKRLEEIRYLREHQKLSIPKIKEMLQVEPTEQADASDASNNLKNLIVDKALELFSKKGLAKTKINDLTDALNLGKGTFYLYFKSKEALFLECIERAPEIIQPARVWEEIRKERNYFQRQRKRAYFMLTGFPTFMGVISIAKLALRGDDPHMKKKATQCFQTINRALTKDIRRAIQNGVVRGVDEELIPFLTFGMAEAAGYWLLMNPNYSPEECADKMLDFISHGFMVKDSNIAVKSNKKTIHGEVEDLSGTKIQLQGIRFNKERYIEGNLGGGKLQIDIEKIGSIELREEGPEHLATVKMKTGEITTIQIDGGVTLSGESPFGSYTIAIAEVIRLVMKPVRENVN